MFSRVYYEQKLALAIQIWLHEVQFLLAQNWLMRGYLGCECKVVVCSYFFLVFNVANENPRLATMSRFGPVEP